MSQSQQQEHSGWTGADLPSLLAAVDESPLPVAVVELPSEVIRAVSQPALDLLGRSRSVIGLSVGDLSPDPPTGGFDLVRTGRLSGYEATRVFQGAQGERTLRVWVRALSDVPPVQAALAVLSPLDAASAGVHLLERDDARPAVIGTADRTLTVDRISADVERLLGAAPGEVLHQSLLRWVDEHDTGSLLLAVAEAVATGRGTHATSTLRRPDGRRVRVAVSIAPLAPAPSFAFALTELPAPTGGDGAATRFLESVGQFVDSAATSHDVAVRCRPVAGLELLTTRELDVVRRLMDGDRVPAIAGSLFLSQSTVRNHLSSVFRKLRVSSQQELVQLLRLK